MEIISLWTACILVALGAGVMPGVHGCSHFTESMARNPDGEYHEQKVYYSGAVIFGRVEAKLTDRKDNNPYTHLPGVYTILLKVFCVYKGGEKLRRMNGGDIPETVYVIGGGNNEEQIPGCPRADVMENEFVVMYLKTTEIGNVLDIEYTPDQLGGEYFPDYQLEGEYSPDQYDDEYILLDDLSLSCGLELISLDEMCYDFEPLPEGECTTYAPPAAHKPETTTIQKSRTVADKESFVDDYKNGVDINPGSETIEMDKDYTGEGSGSGGLIATPLSWFLVMLTVYCFYTIY